MGLNIAVFGKTGQLARALQTLINTQQHNAIFIDRNACDLAGPAKTIREVIHQIETLDVVIIAAAYTAVDAAETDQGTAFRVNSEAPGIIAQACAERGIPMVHVSTDYVFDGTSTQAYSPSHPTQPINCYGASKLAGEQNILKIKCRAAILRTSWVYDGSGKNFMTTMLRLAQTRKQLNVVGDQLGRPTYVGHLADAIMATAVTLCTNDTSNCEGIFHVSNTGDAISWAEFANAIFTQTRAYLPHSMTVTPILTSDYPTAAARPFFSVLNVGTFEDTFEYTLPKWQDGLRAAVNEYIKLNLRA